MKQCWLVAVTAGKGQISSILAAKQAGVKVLGMDGNANAPGLELCDKAIAVDINDVPLALSKLKQENLDIGGVASFCSEAGMILAAHIREAFHLDGPNVAQTLLLTNKYAQRKAFLKAGVPGPKAFEECRTEAEALAFIRKSALPLIVKPTDAAGSRGVTKLESLDGVERIIADAFHHSKSKTIIVESFLPGVEFTVEVFFLDGEAHVLAVTEKKKFAVTKGTVASEIATSRRVQRVNDKIADTAIKAFESLGYRNGIGHAELMYDQDTDSVNVVEVAGRGGGFMIFERLVPESSGLDIVSIVARQAAGISIAQDELAQKKRRAAVLRFLPSSPGVFRGVRGLEEARRLPLVEVGLFIEPGAKLGELRNDGDRFGFVLTSGDSAEEAFGLADRVESMLEVDIT